MRANPFLLLFALVSGASAGVQSASPALAPAPPPPGNGTPHTLVDDRSARSVTVSGWFVAPTFASTGFAGRLAYAPGIRGGLFLNRRFAVGLTASGIGSADTYVSENDLGNFSTYGGLLLQYVVRSAEVVHPSFESTIASGRFCAYTGADTGRLGCTGQDFLVFEPVANVEISVARHLRLATGVGYRVAIAGSGLGPSSRGMSSLVVRTALVLGSF